MHTKAFLVLIAVISLAGCRPQVPSERAFMAAPEGRMMIEAESAPAPEAGIAAPEAGGPEHRVIRTARMAIEVRRVAEAAERAKGVVVKIGGFVSDSRAFEDDAGRKSIALTIRVPAARLGEALGAMRTLGRVRSEETSGEDVTEQYVDLEARLSNAKRLEARLLDLLEKRSKSLKDVLDVEKELARVRESIETMDARKRFFDTRTSMATMEITLTEPPGWGRGIFSPLSGSIQRAFAGFTSSLALLVVVLAAAIPWIALFLLMAWLSLRFLRWWIRRKRELKAKRQPSNN